MPQISSPETTADSKAWAGAIASPAQEFAATSLPVLAGQIPPGLRGSLYRNGPARFERGQQRVNHWFDGDGAVLAVHFGADAVTGVYRYVRSAGFQAEAEADARLYSGYGTLAPGPIWKRWQAQLKNAANTSVLALPDRLLALWEGGFPHQLRLDTLETLGLDDLGQLTGDEPYSAHPKRHHRTGDIFNFGIVAGADATLNLYRSNPQGQIRQKASIPLNGLPLIHDFVLADRYLVFCVPPVRLHALPAVLGVQSFSEALLWQPKRGSQIVVVDADSLEVVAWEQVDPWFQWHFGKGYLDIDGTVVLDVVAYADFSTNQQLREVVDGQIQTPAAAKLRQLRLQPTTGHILDDRVVVDQHCEFPQVACSGQDVALAPTYLSLHAPGRDATGELLSAIGRLDPLSEQLTVADAGVNCYPSEPVYAADAEGGQGWVLTVVYDGNRHCSEVWIYRAEALNDGPVCRLGLPQVIPHSFHGTWQAAA